MVKWDKLVMEWPRRDWKPVWDSVRCFFFHRSRWYADPYADLRHGEPVRVLCRKCSCWWNKGWAAVDLTHIGNFRGMWICLDEQNRVCGVGTTVETAMADAKTRNYQRPALFYVEENGELRD